MGPSNAESTAGLKVGGSELEVGATPGTRASPARAPGAEPDLVRALTEVEDATTGDEVTLGTVATEVVDEAAEVTSGVERATELFEMLAKDRSLDPMQFRPEIDALLDRLAALDRSGRMAEALRLARALEKLVALIRRWQALGAALTTAGRAARAVDDARSVAWVRHELGTFQLAGGDLVAADRNLSAARALRERIGDHAGLRVTDGNLQSLCHQLRLQLRDGGLRQPGEEASGGMRRALLFACALALLAAGGAAGALIAGGDGSDRVDVAPAAGQSEEPAPAEAAPPEPLPEEPLPGEPVPETPVPETPVPETPVPETPVPETPVPETPVPESPVPESPVPEAQPPQEPVPQEPVLR